MNTNINFVGSRAMMGEFAKQGQKNVAVVDPIGMLDESAQANIKGDIEEDPNDRFITSRSGKRRPMLEHDEQEWADEEPIAKWPNVSSGAKPAKVLSRKKRCGGGDNDGGGGGARRTRRTRRRRNRNNRALRNRSRPRRTKSSRTTSTTITRKVFQGDKLVSQTIETKGAPNSQPASTVVQPQVAPALQHQVAPAVQQQVVPAVQQQAAPVMHTVQQPQPVIVQQPPAPAASVPSIAVSGSVKIN